jgi:hypothetical protein
MQKDLLCLLKAIPRFGFAFSRLLFRPSKWNRISQYNCYTTMKNVAGFHSRAARGFTVFGRVTRTAVR